MRWKTRPWPTFELLRPTVDHFNVHGAAHVSDLDQGVPKSLFSRYTTREEASVLNVPSWGDMIWFGTTASHSKICLDPKTGYVVQVVPAPDAPVVMVNSSVDAFTRMAKAVVERFPYYGAGEDREDGVAAELEQLIGPIDPVAMETDGFWPTFLDDVRVGDFATEMFELLSLPKTPNAT